MYATTCTHTHTLLWYSFHPHLTPLAHKSLQPFCQNCRKQVPAKHTCTLHMCLCMKWHHMVHSCMVYIECAKTARISHGTSHVITEQSCKYTTWVDIQNAPQKASHLFKITPAPYMLAWHLRTVSPKSSSESHVTPEQQVCSWADNRAK